MPPAFILFISGGHGAFSEIAYADVGAAILH